MKKQLFTKQYTGYKIDGIEIHFGDLLSNNYKTDKEVIRKIVMHEGIISMKRIKGRSTLPKYISLHEHLIFNYYIIGKQI